MQDIQSNISRILERIASAAERSGRDSQDVRLVAVSKRKPIELIESAMACGQIIFGENYLQEAQEKIQHIGAGPQWHFIGHVQSNKAKAAAELFDCIETLDRLKLAKALEKHLVALNKTMDVLIQVNVGREEQKSGVLPEDAEALLKELSAFEHIKVQGLMTMPPYALDAEQTRPYFRALKSLADELTLKGLLGHDGPAELSMGMSGDFEVAIEEGATLVRVGTALFGARE